MPEIIHKKIGVIACSGEERPEGTVTRLAALRVLHELRPHDTVTICLPLFLAGGEGERNFAKAFPTIALDGCAKRCAFRGTEMYSSQPNAGIVVTELIERNGLTPPQGCRKLDAAGVLAVEHVAQFVAKTVDELQGRNGG